jgi:hypothetical protein
MQNAKIPEYTIVQTLFGPEVAKDICNTCDEELFRHEFYADSVGGKYPRCQCKSCWKRFKGNSTWGRRVLRLENLKQSKENWSYYA